MGVKSEYKRLKFVKLPPRKEKTDVGERLLDNVSLFVQLCFFSSSNTRLILKTPISSLLSYKKPHTMVAQKTVVLLDCWSSSFPYFFQHHGQWIFLDQFLSDFIYMCTYWISNAHWSQALQICELGVCFHSPIWNENIHIIDSSMTILCEEIWVVFVIMTDVLEGRETL